VNALYTNMFQRLLVHRNKRQRCRRGEALFANAVTIDERIEALTLLGEMTPARRASLEAARSWHR